MHIATRTGDLSATGSMSEEGAQPSEHDHVGSFILSQNPQEGIKEMKKSAFEITNVQVDTENEELETSHVHNKTMGEEDNLYSPVGTDMLAASTPSKDLSSTNRDDMQSSGALPLVSSTVTINGPSHLPTAPGSGFRKVKNFSRERWNVTDSLELDADEHSDISELRNVAQKTMDTSTSTSNSPSTPRKNASSLEVASSSNLSDTKSDVQSDDVARHEGATLTEAPGVITSRRASTELSQDDLMSTDDNYESYSQGTPSETNVKTDSESTSHVEIPTNIEGNAETIKSAAMSIITSLDNIINENTRLKQQNELLKQQVERLKKENTELRNSTVQQTPSTVLS